jgi:serine/threonine-protein kinase
MEQIGKYRVVRPIGAGGMGRVYEALDPLIGRRVAIKTLSLDILNDAEARSRFFREARAAGQLSHPHLITIFDTGESDGHPYLVMEFLEGEDLSRVIIGRQLSLSTKLQLMTQMCHGLSYAHDHGVIHRDIKPANIFLTPQGIKILDFGLARGAVSEVTQTGRVLGTPHYMAPEQIRGEGTDLRVDIFSLGVVFYELLSGRKAFEGDSVAATIYKVLEFEPEPIHHWDSTLPSGLSAIVQRALAKDRQARYQRIEPMLADIGRVQSQIEADAANRHATTVVTQVPPRPAARRSFGLAWAAAAVLLVAAAGTV